MNIQYEYYIPFLTILLDAKMSINYTAPLRYYPKKEVKQVMLRAWQHMATQVAMVTSLILVPQNYMSGLT